MRAFTRKEIKALVESLGYNYEYYQFSKDTAVAPPFVVFFMSGSDDFLADGTNYKRAEQLNIEFYSTNKDFDAEAGIEAKLSNAGLTYYKEQNYIDSEAVYQTAYEMEVYING